MSGKTGQAERVIAECELGAELQRLVLAQASTYPGCHERKRRRTNLQQQRQIVHDRIHVEIEQDRTLAQEERQSCLGLLEDGKLQTLSHISCLLFQDGVTDVVEEVDNVAQPIPRGKVLDGLNRVAGREAGEINAVEIGEGSHVDYPAAVELVLRQVKASERNLVGVVEFRHIGENVQEGLELI